jgi:hypothetical protein
MGQLAHVFTISCGVELLGESQVGVQIFGAEKLSDEALIEIANIALQAGPDTALRRWDRANVWRNSEANPLRDNSIIVQYAENKRSK